MLGYLNIILAFVVFVLVATIVSQVRMRKHRGVSRQAFISAFEGGAIPPEIPAAVYDSCKGSVIFKQFSIAPDDSYERVLNKGDEDIADDAEYLVRKLGMELPIESFLRKWEKPLETPRDMVLWLNWVRNQQQNQ